MKGLKTVCIAIVVLCLFIGGIVFDIFVIGKFKNNAAIHHNEDTMSILYNLIQHQSITPSSFQVTLKISGNQKLHDTNNLSPSEREKLIQTLNDIIGAVKDSASMCKGGEYVLGLQNYWKDNQSTQGYDVNQTIKCEFPAQQKDSYTSFVNKILKLSDSNEFLGTSISAPQPFIPNKELNEHYETLQNKILSQVQHLSDSYSKVLNRECRVATINMAKKPAFPLSTNFANNNVLFAKSSDIAVNLPSLEAIEIQSNAEIELQCK